MQERNVVVLPRRPDHLSRSTSAKLVIIKTLEFSSHTLRSGVVVLADDALPGSALLFLRGAPGMIKDLVQPSSVPANFDQVSCDPSRLATQETLHVPCVRSYMHMCCSALNAMQCSDLIACL